MMVSVEDAVIARISRQGHDFEILVDSEKALDFKRGKPFGIENILAVREIFKDARKGDRASSTDLEKFFKTNDVLKIAEEIIRHGEVQITTDQRKKLLEEKKKQIANLISRQAVDPKTGFPHPPARIINAMDQARINIDPFKPPEQQMEGILSAIRPIIPISMERVEVAIKIPVEYSGKAGSYIRGVAHVKNEEWKSDAWIVLIEIPAGMQSEIYERLNSITSGTIEVKVIKRKDV